MKRPMLKAERDRKARIRRIRRDNTSIRRSGGPGRNVVRLVLDHQSFDLGYPMSLRKAKFYQTAIAIALNRFKHGD